MLGFVVDLGWCSNAVLVSGCVFNVVVLVCFREMLHYCWVAFSMLL